MASIDHGARRTRAGMVLVALAATTWGTIGIAVSLLYRVAQTDAFSVGFLRLLIAAPALLLLSRLAAGRSFVHVAPRDLRVMALLGGSFAAYQVCYFAAIPRLGVASAVLINICSAPIFVVLMARMVLGERLPPAARWALVGAVGGTALLVGLPGAGAPLSLVGTGLALGAGLSSAVVAVCSRAVAGRYHPAQPVAIAFTVGALLLLPVALARGLVFAYPARGWLLLVHLGLVPTALAYALYLWGLRTTSATVAAVITLLEPLISTVLAVALLDEELTGTGIAGAALLLASIGHLYLQSPRRSVDDGASPSGGVDHVQAEPSTPPVQ